MTGADVLFWCAFAALVLVACSAALWGLARPPAAVVVASQDVAFYRRQLDELDQDAARGVLTPEGAESARIEISRRLLQAAAVDKAASEGDAERRRRRVAAVVALLIIPALAFPLYARFGTPDTPGLPLYAREERLPPQQDIASLVAKVEKHLAEKPDDARGWELLAPVYARMGRYADAARARGNILRILGPSADREADYGEALAASAQGGMSAEAKAAFARALAIDPKHPKARFYQAMALEADGKRDEAVNALRTLLAESPADAPWRGVVAQEINRLSGTKQEAPSADGAAAVAALPADQQGAAIAGMVDRLAERLAQDGSDFEGWLRLIRAYTVMRADDRRAAAVAKVRERFGAEPDKMTRLDALLSGQGG